MVLVDDRLVVLREYRFAPKGESTPYTVRGIACLDDIFLPIYRREGVYDKKIAARNTDSY